MNQVIAYILKAGQVVFVMGPIALDLATELKALLAVDGSDFDVQIKTISEGAVKDAQETVDLIDEWKRQHPQA
jgi:hypothetical protein